MKKRFHLLLLILTLGCYLSPSYSHACGTKTEKSCCKKETPAKTEKKDCCKSKESKEKDNRCGGKCGHSNCTSASVNYSLISFSETQFNTTIFDFSTEKSKFYHLETILTSGFRSTWIPPKIK
jgi:hypothetical protein